jgi:hypothetical protein
MSLLSVLNLGAAFGRFVFLCIGAYVTALVALDEVSWSRHRYWRHVSAGLLALLMVGILEWPIIS